MPGTEPQRAPCQIAPSLAGPAPRQKRRRRQGFRLWALPLGEGIYCGRGAVCPAPRPSASRAELSGAAAAARGEVRSCGGDVHTHTHTHTYAHAGAHTRTHTHTHSRTRTRTRTRSARAHTTPYRCIPMQLIFSSETAARTRILCTAIPRLTREARIFKEQVTCMHVSVRLVGLL